MEEDRSKKDLPVYSVKFDTPIPTRTIFALYHTPQQIGNHQLPAKSPYWLYTCTFFLLFYTIFTMSIMTKLVKVAS